MWKNHPHLWYLLQDHVHVHQMDQFDGNESFPLFLPFSIVEIMLIGCIPEQVIIDFKNKLSCGTSHGPPHRIKNMDLAEIIVLLDSRLKECDSHSFWNFVSIRDKDIKQPEFLYEMAEKLPRGVFPTVCET